MILFDLKKMAVVAALALFTVMGSGLAVSAQYDRDSRERQRIERQQAKIAEQRARLERQRQAEWEQRNNQIVDNRRGRNGGDYYSVNENTNFERGRYRVNRNGRWYNTNERGAQMLRQAVSEGYRQGFNAGRSDMRSNRRSSWSNSNAYRTGTYGYQNNSVDRGQYQHYFRQGFQRGYQDGSNSQNRDNRNNTYRYGSYENGQPNILSAILNQILNIQRY